MKDLRKVEQDLSSVIIIDNSATGYELQPSRLLLFSLFISIENF